MCRTRTWRGAFNKHTLQRSLNDLCLHFCKDDLHSLVLSQPWMSTITMNLLFMSQFTSYQGPGVQRQWQRIVRFLNLQHSVLPRCKKVTWSQLMKVTGSACHLPCSLCAVQTSIRLLKPQALYISSALKPVARGITAQNLSTGFLVSDLTSYKPLLSALAAQIRWKAAPSSQNNTHKKDGGAQ